MRRTFNLLNQNCRLATRLVSDSTERPLDRLERTGLAIHLMGCRSCRRYRDQIRVLDQLVHHAEDSPAIETKLPIAARDRITQVLADQTSA